MNTKPRNITRKFFSCKDFVTINHTLRAPVALCNQNRFWIHQWAKRKTLPELELLFDHIPMCNSCIEYISEVWQTEREREMNIEINILFHLSNTAQLPYEHFNIHRHTDDRCHAEAFQVLVQELGDNYMRPSDQ